VSRNSNIVQVVQQTIQEKADGSKNITQFLSNVAVQQASGGSKNVNQVIRQAAQIIANRADVPVEKVEAVIIQIALQISQAQGKSITAQFIFQIANKIIQNPNGVLGQAILNLVNQDDCGKSSHTTTVIKNYVKSSSSIREIGRDPDPDPCKKTPTAEGCKPPPDPCEEDPNVEGCEDTEPIEDTDDGDDGGDGLGDDGGDDDGGGGEEE
jgi:hypothetical protein